MDRKRIIQATLGALKRHGIGFRPHALYTSGVADLHIRGKYEGAMAGGIVNPASMGS